MTGEHSTDEVIDILHAKGLSSRRGKKIAHSVMVNILKNPFYSGVLIWNGHNKKGRHEPMITPNEHKQIQEIMDAHNLHACRRRKHSFLLRGFIFCNICGHRYVGEIHHSRNKAYYHCGSMRKHSNRGQNVEVSTLEQEIEKQFESIQFSPEFTERMISKLKERCEGRRKAIVSEKQILYNRKKAIESKRDKAEDKLLDGVIANSDFQRLREKFAQELSNIQDQIEELENQEELDIDAVHEVLKMSRNIHQTYMAAPYELKRRYLALFWDKFFVQDKKIVEAIPTDLIVALQREKHVILMIDWLPELDSNQ
jgi:hypothetical protein